MPTSKVAREFLTKDADFKKHGIERDFTLNTLFKEAWSKEARKSDHGKGPKRRRRRRIRRQNKKGDMVISGFFATTGLDRQKDIITIQALKDAVNDLLAEGSNTAFLNHDTDMPIGRVVSTIIKKINDVEGLFGDIFISTADDVRSTRTKLEEEVLNAFSVRGRIKRLEIVRNDEGQIDHFVIHKMTLMEVSVVGLPANTEASIVHVVTKSVGKRGSDIMNRKPASNKTRSKIMKGKDKKNRKLTITQVIKEIVPEMIEAAVDEAIGKASEGMTKSVKETIAETIKEVLKVDKPDKPEDKTEKDKKDEKKDSEEVVELKKKLVAAEKKVSDRKGSQEDGDQDEDEETPKKALKGPTDENTIKFLKYVMLDEPSAYETLSDAEKEKAGGIWLQLMVAENTK